MQILKDFLRDESGHDKIEYTLTMALIALVLIVSFQVLGDTVNDWFADVSSGLDAI